MPTNSMTSERWVALQVLKTHEPTTRANLKAVHKVHTKTLKVLTSRGWAIANGETDDAWVMLTQTGRQLIDRIERQVPRPFYAGGPEKLRPGHPHGRAGAPGKKPTVTRVTDADVRTVIGEVLALPAPTMPPPTAAVDLTVTLTVPLTMCVPVGTFDAQAVRSEVEKVLAAKGVAPFIAGWVVSRLLVGDTVVFAHNPPA